MGNLQHRSSDCNTETYLECELNKWIWLLIAIPQIVLGTIGNVLNLIVLSRQRMKQYSTTMYLLFLAGADLTTLWTSGVPRIFVFVWNIDLWAITQFCCKTIRWINHTSASFSVWLIVLLSIERMLLIRYPLLARSKLSRKNAFYISLSFLILLTLVCAHYPFGMEVRQMAAINNPNVTKQVCDFTSEGYDRFYSTTWALIILFVLNCIPVLFVIIANSVIVLEIYLQRKRLAKVNPAAQRQKLASNRQSKSTTMIFLISGVFIFTTMPYSINRALKTKRPEVGGRQQAKYTLQDSLFTLLLFCNYTVNFLLYFLSGTLFAQEMRAFISECKAKFRKTFSRKQQSDIHLASISHLIPTNFE